MSITRAILGTLDRIPDALGDADEDELYDVAEALRTAREGVLEEAFQRLLLRESRTIIACRWPRSPRPLGGDVA